MNDGFTHVATLDPASGADATYLDRLLSESRQSSAARRQRGADPKYLKRLTEFNRLLQDVKGGRVSPIYLQETMTTSDFPILFGDVIHRRVVGKFPTSIPEWKSYTQVTDPVPDFRDIKLIDWGGLSGRWASQSSWIKPEMTAVREGMNLQEAVLGTYHVDVYERAFAYNWRMSYSDQYGIFSGPDLAGEIVIGARRSESFFVTSMYVDANGPNATLYTSGNKNIVNTANGAASNNPVFGVQGLKDAMTVLTKMTDPYTGEPITIGDLILVVPPALEIDARMLLQPQAMLTIGGYGQNRAPGDAGIAVNVAPTWMRERISQIVMNPYIPVVASTANGNSSWFLFAAQDNNRPAMMFSYLAGWDGPQIFRKMPDTQRMGGGTDDRLGDFETGEQKFKVMHVFGGRTLEPRATVASNGSGV